MQHRNQRNRTRLGQYSGPALHQQSKSLAIISSPQSTCDAILLLLHSQVHSPHSAVSHLSQQAGQGHFTAGENACHVQMTGNRSRAISSAPAYHECHASSTNLPDLLGQPTPACPEATPPTSASPIAWLVYHPPANPRTHALYTFPLPTPSTQHCPPQFAPLHPSLFNTPSDCSQHSH